MVNINLFRHFVPLRSLTPSDRAHLAKHAEIVAHHPGRPIFNMGDSAKKVAFLLEGEVELTSERGRIMLRANTDESRHAFGAAPRRTVSAICIKAAQVLYVDREMLDMILTWAQTGGVEVVELQDKRGEDETQDWMTALLQSKAFLRIPPANIAQIFAVMEAVSVQAGDSIIRQGDPGDYYYVITEGRCQVVVQDEQRLQEEEISQIGVGRGFGEEALVSGNPRNATVRALSRTALMRLSAVHFNRLLKAPLLKEVQLDQAPADAQLVDVRVPGEFARGHLAGSINVPLARLRELAGTLDPRRLHLIYCDTGRRSASATFLLCERGLNAQLVAGGVPEARLLAAG